MSQKNTLSRAISSEKYREARMRIDSWHERIRGGAKGDIMLALREKNGFFASMRKHSPGLYALLEADDRALSQAGIRKITGKEIIID